MREICEYEFEAIVCGEKRAITGKDTNQFDAERIAIIQVMRNEGVSYDNIEIKKVLSEKPTGIWI